MINSISSYKNNFYWLKWMSGLRFFEVLLPFYVIYAHHIGLTYEQIFATQAVYALCTILFTIPCGIFSDLFGRKISLTIGSFCLLIGALCFLTMPNFFGFSLAEAILSLGMSFFACSESAFLYDSTQRMDKLSLYLGQESKIQAYARLGESLSALLAGLLASINLYLLVLVTVIRAIPLTILSFFLKETMPQKVSIHDFKQRVRYKIKKQILHIKHFLFKKRRVMMQMTIMYSSLVSCITLTAFWLLQVIIDQYHLSYIYVGLTLLVYQLTTSIASNYAATLIKICSTKILFILPLLLFIMINTIGFINKDWGYIFIILAAATFGIKMPLIYYILNQNSTITTRASLLSMDALVTRLLFTGLALLVGYLLDNLSIHTVFLVLLIPNLLAGILSFFIVPRLNLIGV